MSLCRTVFLIDTPLTDIPNPQLFQNKIFIKKEGNTYPLSSCKMALLVVIPIFQLSVHLASNGCYKSSTFQSPMPAQFSTFPAPLPQQQNLKMLNNEDSLV
ncbi:hypothetical protein NC651_040336 [Populus alba x Populus x berolinensis]|nr:hypothetical protein NC651_040336 [Populus alba x Populus x berolinensis]